MDIINKLVLDHVLASHGIVVLITLVLAKLDAVILFALRFFSADTINAELDRLDQAAKARVSADAAQPPKP